MPKVKPINERAEELTKALCVIRREAKQISESSDGRLAEGAVFNFCGLAESAVEDLETEARIEANRG